MSDEIRNRNTVQFKQGEPITRPATGVRWWPLLLIIAGVTGFVMWTWLVRDAQRQDRNLATALAGIVGIPLVLFWCLFLSRLRWRVRLLSVGLFVAAAVTLASLVTIRGVTGDLVPILAWRWEEALEQLKPKPAIFSTNLPAAASATMASDFPQYFGPRRNGVIDGVALARDWSGKPPQLVWRRPVGAGWAGFAVASDQAVTIEQANGEEVVAAYVLNSGAPLWRHQYAARYDTPVGGTGPRTVPTIISNRVYTVGATGWLTCLELDSGKRVWSKNVLAENGAGLPAWGVAGSPLYLAGKIVVNPGGSGGRSLVAYDAATGERVWGGGDAAASYSSPILASLGGAAQILMFNQPRITSHDPLTGAVLWEYKWGAGQPHVALPLVVSDDTVMFSSGYGVGAELLRVNRDAAGAWSVGQVWKSIRLKAKFASFVRRGDFVYGLDDGMLACVALADGSQRWKEGRHGHGQLLLVGDLLLVTTEGGEVVLLEPTPEAPIERGRFRAFDHKQWNPPALAGGWLLVRTDREAACYQLPLAASASAASTGL